MKVYDSLKNIEIKKGNKRKIISNDNGSKKKKNIKGNPVPNVKISESDCIPEQTLKARIKIKPKKAVESVDDAEIKSEYFSEPDINSFQDGNQLSDFEKVLENYVLPESEVNSRAPRKKKSEKTRVKLKKIKEKKGNSLPAKHPDAEIRTVYVGNVNINIKRRKVESFFSKYGKVESVRLRGVAAEDLNISKKEAIVKRKLHPKSESVIAFVRFEDLSSKEKALSANGEVLGGLHLRVDCATKGVTKKKNSIFIGNLPFEVKDEDVWEFFKGCGEIESVRIVRSSLTRAGKGIGFVAFKDKDGVEMALRFNGKLFNNRVLRIQRAVKKVKEKHSRHPMPKKSAMASLVRPKANTQKMNLSFLKQDKPSYVKAVKEKHAARKARSMAHTDSSLHTFTGKKAVEEGKVVKKVKKQKLTKTEKKKRAIAQILKAK